MKLAFISDIHGNAIALQAVLDDIGRHGVEQIYVLGDLAYRGPQPKQALDLVRALQTKVIKGNADEWVVRGVEEGEVPDPVRTLMNQERDWICSQLTPDDQAYLAALPTQLHLEVGAVRIHAFHATPNSLFEIVGPQADDADLQNKLMQAADAGLYVYAHIHKPYIRYVQGKVVMNIGSVGLPFDGMARSSYGIVEIDGERIRASIERVAYDLEAVVHEYASSGYPNAEMMSRVIRTARI